jgi:hypothetical protein
MKSVIKCSYKANVEAGAETFESQSRSRNKKLWIHNTEFIVGTNF